MYVTGFIGSIRGMFPMTGSRIRDSFKLSGWLLKIERIKFFTQGVVILHPRGLYREGNMQCYTTWPTFASTPSAMQLSLNLSS